MARLVSMDGDPRGAEARHIGVRYRFDEAALVKSFGGAERLRELCAVYGVPVPPANFGQRRNGVRQSAYLGAWIPVLLELAQRMHRELDLYEFVVELR